MSFSRQCCCRTQKMLNQRQLKILMLQHGIDSQAKLAKKLKVKPWTLCRTIKGRYPDAKLIAKIAKLFRVDPLSLKRAA